ncbi:fungal-specific transcription factor domain-containing protein [Microdochium trichocladiopsis]|uniref:Fungal-specific transcription factor domain-containing protein n=1 Tax=Microdochium trichocladiopsis TaxID=1682393 RepID=A0A9P8Y561_9PEZI|nr:fungal-specific transcription factor domain-containing protein [Microdochium trichocladiopsis]KAH7031387.1 fungal-specific transcription factor domain-containing protein [Microdochium trichocladiopsis]
MVTAPSLKCRIHRFGGPDSDPLALSGTGAPQCADCSAAERAGRTRDGGPVRATGIGMDSPGSRSWHGALPRHGHQASGARPWRRDTLPVNRRGKSRADGSALGGISYRHLSSVHVPANARQLHPPREPSHPLYDEAQLIFDGIHYYNEMVSSTLLSIGAHFNPYRVDLARIDSIPRIYINMLVTAATLHRAMQDEANDQHETQRSAITRSREQDIFLFRIRALREVNQRLSMRETQTTDSTLMCVLCLLLCAIQQSALGDWRAHLEGARTIIKMRGGLKQIAAENHYFRPLLVIYVVIDVSSATTTSTRHPKMSEAASMALHYWEAAPNMFQANLAISAPCPEELFQSIILINYLRTTVCRPSMRSRRQGGTRMVLEKVRSFNIPKWAARMKKFKGWRRSGDSVDFEDESTPPRTLSSSSDSSSAQNSPGEDHAMSTSQTGSPDTTSTSPRQPAPDIWLDVAVMWHSAVLLYATRTLLLDVDEPKDFLIDNGAYTSPWTSTTAAQLLQEILDLRRATHEVLLETLTPAFSDPETAREVGKLVFFPAFTCGMEISGHVAESEAEATLARQELVSNGLELIGQACGTMAPISAAEEVRIKWALEAQEQRTIRWDDYFTARPDFTFGF